MTPSRTGSTERQGRTRRASPIAEAGPPRYCRARCRAIVTSAAAPGMASALAVPPTRSTSSASTNAEHCSASIITHAARRSAPARAQRKDRADQADERQGEGHQDEMDRLPPDRQALRDIVEPPIADERVEHAERSAHDAIGRQPQKRCGARNARHGQACQPSDATARRQRGDRGESQRGNDQTRRARPARRHRRPGARSRGHASRAAARSPRQRASRSTQPPGRGGRDRAPRRSPRWRPPPARTAAFERNVINVASARPARTPLRHVVRVASGSAAAERQHDLPAMMVDPPGLHLRQDRPADRREHDRGAHLRHAAQPQRQRGCQRHRAEQRQQRHDVQRGGRRRRLRRSTGSAADHRRDRHIDQPRPVHRKSRAGAEAMLADVPPALPGQPVAHLEQAHRVVGIGETPDGDIVGVHHAQHDAGQHQSRPAPRANNRAASPRAPPQPVRFTRRRSATAADRSPGSSRRRRRAWPAPRARR